MRLLSKKTVENERALEEQLWKRKIKALAEEVHRLEKQSDIVTRLRSVEEREREAERLMEIARDLIEDYQDKIAHLAEKEQSFKERQASLDIYERHLKQVNDKMRG